jgi:hypothetical protein
MKQLLSARFTLLIFIVVAALYSSWLLGFLLDPSTAQYGLASDLEYPGHPYYWVFILSDIFVGVSLTLIVAMMQVRLKRKFWSWLWAPILLGLLLFGLLSATSADSPLTCEPGYIRVCLTIGHHKLGPDSVESTLASAGLFISLVSAGIVSWRLRLNRYLGWLTWLTTIFWLASAVLFVRAADINRHLHNVQQLLLSATAIAILIIGLNVYAILQKDQPDF